MVNNKSVVKNTAAGGFASALALITGMIATHNGLEIPMGVWGGIWAGLTTGIMGLGHWFSDTF